MKNRIMKVASMVACACALFVSVAHADLAVMADSATASVGGAVTAVGPAVVGIAGFCAAVGVVIALLRKAAK
jgi:hypothetical protein